MSFDYVSNNHHFATPAAFIIRAKIIRYMAGIIWNNGCSAGRATAALDDVQQNIVSYIACLTR